MSVVMNSLVTGNRIPTEYDDTSVTISGGSIDGTTVGATTPSTGKFTSLTTTENTVLGDATTDTVHIQGTLGIGGVANASYGARIVNAALTGTSQYGMVIGITTTSAATSAAYGAYIQALLPNTAFTCANLYNIYIPDAGKGASATLTNQYGAYIASQTKGINNYGVYSATVSTVVSKTISKVAVASNVVTITTTAAHGFMVGRTVTVSATTNTAVNGSYAITSTPTTTTFTYAKTTTDITETSDTGTVVMGEYNYNLYLPGTAPSHIAGSVGIGETSPDYKLDVNGTLGFTPGSSVTPVDNGDVVFELTNNTTLTIKAKGSDGTVRSVALTLA